MKKVLIFLRENNVLPKGGPSGYVYNLLKGMPTDDEVEFHLLPPVNVNAKAKSKYNSLPLWIKKIYRCYAHLKEYRAMAKPNFDVNEEYLAQFDVIHFHSCLSLYAHIGVLKNYKGKVILTSHSPKPPHIEMLEDFYSPFERKIFGKRHLKKYEEAVAQSYERADYVIYPCYEAEESYNKNWPKYAELRKRIDDKIVYIPTGVESCREKAKRSKAEICKEYGVPEDSFIISYVGRHNEVKGYNVLKEIASKFKASDNVYFLIAGEEAPLKRPKLDFWVEAGWTNDPYSIEAASDLFVLPNKETYFDLVLLEVLSIGTKVLTTFTGGNKFFEQYESDITFFNGVDDAVLKIKQLIENKDNTKKEESKNRMLFEKEFTSERFAGKYLSFLKKI